MGRGEGGKPADPWAQEPLAPLRRLLLKVEVPAERLAQRPLQRVDLLSDQEEALAANLFAQQHGVAGGVAVLTAFLMLVLWLGRRVLFENDAHGRLTKEISNLIKSPPKHFAVGPERGVGGPMDRWHAHMYGPAGSPYSGGIFHVLILPNPAEYPWKPPKFFFKVTKNGHWQIISNIHINWNYYPG